MSYYQRRHNLETRAKLICFLLPSTSTSAMRSAASLSVTFSPRFLITVDSSLVVIVPSPSSSNRENASLNSTPRERRKDKKPFTTIISSFCSRFHTAKVTFHLFRLLGRKGLVLGRRRVHTFFTLQFSKFPLFGRPEREN